MKKNAIPPIQAHEVLAFPRDVPRAAPSGHPSEKPDPPSLGWEVYTILSRLGREGVDSGGCGDIGGCSHVGRAGVAAVQGAEDS